MRPERALVAQRALAQHCEELIRPAPDAGELLPCFGRAGDRLARALCAALTPLLGEPPLVRCEPPRETQAEGFMLGIGVLAANSLLTGPGSTRLCLSVEADGVLRLVDRAFGGRGEAPDPLPEAFPLSAELMIGRIEALCTAALAQALDLGPAAFGPLARAGSMAELEPFAAATRLAALALDVTEANGSTWAVQIALPLAALPALLGEAPAPPATARQGGRFRHPADEPFGDVPLTLSAVLVDMRIGMAALSALRPGDVLPVAVARSVPLQAGGRTIAHGQVGAMDDRVALQLIQTF